MLIPLNRYQRWSPVKGVLVVVAGMLPGILLGMLSACGKRTDPLPVENILPPSPTPRAWLREKEAIVTWPLPTGKRPVRGFRLWVERLPPGCRSCAALDSRRHWFALEGAASLRLEGGSAHHVLALSPQLATWRFRLAIHYQQGRGRWSTADFLDVPAHVPRHALHWETAGERNKKGERSIRLYWKARREQVVETITSAGAVFKTDRHYRVNLYRRQGDAPWPLRPFNIQPLRTRQLTLRLPADEGAEFHLRLVDQFGNEGPASATVKITPGRGR